MCWSQMCYHKFLALWMSYHMATLTMQYYKRTGEMKDETLSFPFKDKPFGFSWTMNFIYLLFRENVMCWSYPCTMACVDRIPKMTESLYHSVVCLKASKGLDYWWIDCDSVHTWQMNMPYQQDFYILFLFVCKCFFSVCFQCGWWTTTSHYCRDNSWSTQQVPTL